LVRQFQGPLRTLAPEAQARIAEQFYLLVDMRFTDIAWWSSAARHPATTPGTPRGAFAKGPSIQMGRAAILLLRHATEIFGPEACLFGAHPRVLLGLSNLSLGEIDRLLDRFFREVRPRWESRPAVWEGLLVSAGSPNIRAKREVDLAGLQLLASQILE
jgi:hypothetical protein